MSDQPELFDRSIETPQPQLRPPGWQLVSGTGGVQGWHLIAQVSSGNSVTTYCGIVGRVLGSPERMIVCCPNCQARLPG